MDRFQAGKEVYELEVRGCQLHRRTGSNPEDEDVEVYRTSDEAYVALDFVKKDWLRYGYAPIQRQTPQILLGDAPAPRRGPVAILDAHGRPPVVRRPIPVRRIRGRDRLGPKEALERADSVTDEAWEDDMLVSATLLIGDVETEIEEVLANPYASRLRRVAIRSQESIDSSKLLDHLHERLPSTVTDLSLVAYEVVENFDAAILDVSAHSELLARMERLELSSGKVVCAPIAFRRLSALTVAPRVLTRELVAALQGSERGELRELSLWFGSPEDGATATADDVLELLATCPRLTKLGLATCETVHELLRRIAGTELASRLEALDVSTSLFDDEGLDLLASGVFPRLAALDTTKTRLTHAGWERAKERFPFAALDYRHARITSVRGFRP